jgi:hypothetical protein
LKKRRDFLKHVTGALCLLHDIQMHDCMYRYLLTYNNYNDYSFIKEYRYCFVNMEFGVESENILL